MLLFITYFKISEMQTLDLHGIKHSEVEAIVENFILINERPLKIITGSSNEMKKLTHQVLKKYNFKYIYPNDFNLGELLIYD